MKYFKVGSGRLIMCVCVLPVKYDIAVIKNHGEAIKASLIPFLCNKNEEKASPQSAWESKQLFYTALKLIHYILDIWSVFHRFVRYRYAPGW